MIRLWVFFLNSIFKLNTVAAIFPGNNPAYRKRPVAGNELNSESMFTRRFASDEYIIANEYIVAKDKTSFG